MRTTNMLNEHTLDQLRGLRLDGMVHGLTDQAGSTTTTELDFDRREAVRAWRCWCSVRSTGVMANG